MILAALVFIEKLRKPRRCLKSRRSTSEGLAQSCNTRHSSYVVIFRIHGPFCSAHPTARCDRFSSAWPAPIIILRLRNMTAIDSTGSSTGSVCRHAYTGPGET